jgi:hypothetical protein
LHFEHLIEINNPLNPLIEPLSVEQVWHGLMYRVEEPTVFLPGLERCTILSRQGRPGGARAAFRPGQRA